jgi:hypothetical protein
MGSLQLYFDGQFWVGIVTGTASDGSAGIARVVFGAEPSNAELVDWVLHEYRRLELLHADSMATPLAPKGNPKRRMREVARAIAAPVKGTASQRALQEALQSRKLEAATAQRAEREEARVEKFLARQEKKKRKHRGK